MDLKVCINRSTENPEAPRYWVSIRTAVRDRDGKPTDEMISASLMCNLSRTAKEAFEVNSVKTKSDDVRQLYCLVTDGWFKAVKTKKGTAPVLFVNSVGPAPKKQETSANKW